MAKAGKKASKKRKAKKARKALPARAGKKAAAKKRAAKKGATKSKRVVKKAGKASKKAAKKVAQKSPKKAAKKAATKPAKKPAKKSANKTTKARAVTSQETNPAVPAAPVAKRAKPTTPRAKPAVVVQPAVAAERNTYFITTPIFYPNGIPHIGHAYTAMVTDAIARFQRLDGKFDVRFLTGTDEHGLKMQQTAVAEGLTPLALADRNSARFREMMTALNISYRRLHPHHRAAPRARVPGTLACDREERRYLSRQICRLVFGPSGGLFRRGGNHRRD